MRARDRETSAAVAEGLAGPCAQASEEAARLLADGGFADADEVWRYLGYSMVMAIKADLS